MLDLGGTTGRTCRGRSRRAFLRVGTLGALGLTLGDLLALRSAAGDAPGPGPRAKAAIVLWLWGGPSHLDTFDPKPDAPLEYRGPFESVATAAPGVRVCELLPGLARRADRFALIRSMHHESNDHGVAGTIALTGSIAGAVDLGGGVAGGALMPSTGAIVSRISGRRPGGLPPYVILGNQLHQGHKRVVGEGGGVLGAAHDPFRIDYEPGVGPVLPDVHLPEGVTADRMAARWQLFERSSAAGSASKPAEALAEHYDLARRLIASRESLSALEIDREAEATREAYGPHRFGRCCLIARRLVEAGLPFVQVNWSTHVEGPEDAGDGGWDMHDRYFSVMQDRHGWMLDRALSALLDDLEARGLLDSTLVVAVGEFGRTPRINAKAGRDHWNSCYSALLAGAGVPGGAVVGSSDRRAEFPVEHPVHPADLSATILGLLGIGAAELTGIGLTPTGTPVAGLT
ncbi:DUF1501 domain-containing protein [Tautonia plasticadhaerens]|uniref:DUF1501 domain-containing protein n=1 Tax=Tautonia plasticadhaerens TaxID=2527974 RepID=A0A518H3T7_9BACT|nr:DUF1501 domain-containing protein [Tautonia plasticadhaerens]QDV35478.1 hypothetical protein ElP_33810 [Tautonia plasticadhaerens]